MPDNSLEMHTPLRVAPSNTRFWNWSDKPCLRPHAPASVIDCCALVAGFGLMFGFVFLMLSGRGAFDSEDLYGIGRLWAITDFALLGYVLLCLQLLSWRTLMVNICCIWMAWVSSTCLQLSDPGFTAMALSFFEVLYCPLFFLFFYILLKRQPDWIGMIVGLFLVLLGFCGFLFWLVWDYRNLSTKAGSALLNDSYYALLLLPFVLIARQRFLKFSGTALVSLVVFWSMKRTAFAALLTALIVYFVIDLARSRSRVNWRWLAGVAAIILLLAGLFVVVDQKSGGYLVTRMEAIQQDRGSNRLDIYEDVLSLQAESPPDKWFFGHGHDAVKSEMSKIGRYAASAHNDWQEVLFDYGVPGFLLYVLFHLCLLRLNWRLIRQGSEFAPALAASYAILFTLSLSSHLVLYATYFSYLMAFWGIVVAIDERIVLIGNPFHRDHRPGSLRKWSPRREY